MRIGRRGEEGIEASSGNRLKACSTGGNWIGGIAFSRVELFVDLFEAGAVDVGVDLGCCDVGVAQHFLDDAEVGSAYEQVRCEAVAQHVGVDLEAGGFSVVLHELPDADAFEGAACAREQQRALAAAVEFVEFGAAVGNVIVDCLLGGLAHGDEALFVAFAGDADDADGGMDVGQGDRADFAGAQAAGVEEFEQCAVAQVDGCCGLFGGNLCGGGEEFAHLRGREDVGEFFPARGAVEDGGGVELAAIGGAGPAEEDADGGEVTDDTRAVEVALGFERGEVKRECARLGLRE